jgi:V/A-type H+/Na+-transporting ATPase subunit F
MSMSKIGVIGDRDSILGFKAIGVDVFPQTDGEKASRLLHQLVKDQYAVLFVTEELAAQMDEAIERYRAKAFPTIIMIPGNQGSTGVGIQGIKDCVERAVGADILFGEKG